MTDYRRQRSLMIASACGLWIALMILPAGAQKRRTVEVPKEIVEELLRHEDLKDLIRVRSDGSAENLVANPIRLSTNVYPELEVHGIGSDICGAANCVTWIYRKTRNGYQMLLDANSIEGVEPQRTSTKGYRDIIASMHGLAWDSDLTLFKFDGKRYQRVGCFHRTFRYSDRHGAMREHRRPKITPEKCDPTE